MSAVMSGSGSEIFPLEQETGVAFKELSSAGQGDAKKERGPMMEALFLFMLMGIIAAVAGAASDANVHYLVIGWRSMIALAGYIVMQVGLWHAENKWDAEGSQAWLDAAAGEESRDLTLAPEALDAKFRSGADGVMIPADKLKAAFPVPWGFLVGWWLWGISYLFPIDGTTDVHPTGYGIAACVICFLVSFDASVPMSDAVQNRLPKKKMVLSLLFLVGWLSLGVMSSLDAIKQVEDFADLQPYVVVLCMLGPITIIFSQKILFGARKMGTLWEVSGKPNFHPIVYNMGGPLFVWGWFMLLMGTCGIPSFINPDSEHLLLAGKWIKFSADHQANIPLFLNVRTLVAFVGGCGMVPVVRWLDYSHDEDGPWLGENTEGKVFGKWWLGTDGTYFGVFLESPWPFVIMWAVYGFSAFITVDNKIGVHDNGVREALLCLNCVLQGIDAGILIQANLYAGNMAGKTKFSIPFVLLFILLAFNIGLSWDWKALALSLPGAFFVILGQKTVFGDRKRGDFTMQNEGKANPYDTVNVYSWGEVFFMIGWILICWAMSLPQDLPPVMPN